MWRVYLDSTASISLHPQPWTTWHLWVNPRARVRIVDSASHWCDLVEEFPTATENGLAANWLALAQEFDGVEVTLGAVMAAHEITLVRGASTYAPVSWTTQTTVWLNWSFTSASRAPSRARG
jgi:hypothetical protein